MEKIWLKHYPPSVPALIDVAECDSLVALLEDSFRKYRDLPACKFMGHTVSFGKIDALSTDFAAWLQAQGFVKGDRVALMMPNVPQYPIAVAGVLRAGCVVVNVNPLYTPRELEHQLRDSGATGIVVLENFATTLQQVLPTVAVRKIVITALGDLLAAPKSWIVNTVVRHVKKLVPPYTLPGAVRFSAALSAGRQHTLRPTAVGPDDIAVL